MRGLQEISVEDVTDSFNKVNKLPPKLKVSSQWLVSRYRCYPHTIT